jgi:type I site-specific restriction-modification system R (restriction) subunit
MNIQVIEKPVSETSSCLYEEDFFLWLETTVKLLKEGRLNELDIANLTEEIEAMGRSEKNSIESNLEVLLMHLLKYKYQPKKLSKSWLLTIYEHRKRIKKAFKNSPSLKRYYQEKFLSCYQESRKMASIETGLNINIFPENCPFELELILDSDYLPE